MGAHARVFFSRRQLIPLTRGLRLKTGYIHDNYFVAAVAKLSLIGGENQFYNRSLLRCYGVCYCLCYGGNPSTMRVRGLS